MKYFLDEIGIDCSSWTTINKITPQQVGDKDCGVFMCQFAKIGLFQSYSDIPDKVDVKDMLGWRNMMILELASGKIRWKTD
jgi:Ulp1 family protease